MSLASLCATLLLHPENLAFILAKLGSLLDFLTLLCFATALIFALLLSLRCFSGLFDFLDLGHDHGIPNDRDSTAENTLGLLDVACRRQLDHQVVLVLREGRINVIHAPKSDAFIAHNGEEKAVWARLQTLKSPEIGLNDSHLDSFFLVNIAEDRYSALVIADCQLGLSNEGD